MKPITVLVDQATGEAFALADANPVPLSAPPWSRVQYVPAPSISFDWSPVPERNLAALRRLVAYGKASAAEALRRGHSDETKPAHRPLFMGRSDGFEAMADALEELVRLMEIPTAGVVPLRKLPEPR